MSDDMSLDDLAEQLEKEGDGEHGKPSSSIDDTPVPIGMAAQILAEALLGRSGIAGISAEADNPGNGITVMVLEGFMEAATEGAPTQIYGYDLHFKSVTIDEINTMSQCKDAQVYNGPPGKLTEVKAAGVEGHETFRERLKKHMLAAGYSENQVYGIDTMSEMACRLIFRKYESAHERNMLAATMIAASRLIDACTEDKKLAGEADLAGAVQEELACLDTSKLDEIDADSAMDSRAVKILEIGVKYITGTGEIDKRMTRETAKMILGIANEAGKEKAPPQPAEPSPYQKLLEDPDTF
jgi:hypothetical protein